MPKTALIGIEVALVGILACSAESPSSRQATQTAQPWTSAPSAVGNGNASKAAVLYFDGDVDVARGTMKLAIRSPSGELKEQATLPYGNVAGDVYFHTCSGSAYSAVGAGGSFSAVVQAVNKMSAAIPDLSVQMDVITDPGTTFSTSPAGGLYGAVPNTGAADCAANELTWKFTQATTMNFQFRGEADGTPPPSPKLVFVTPGSYTANLGGVAGANAICQSLASTAGLTGTFKAWISDSLGNSPSTTFTQSSAPYKLVNGTTVAANWAGLISGTLLAGIDANTYGVVQSLQEPMTGTTATGTPAPYNCSNFTSTASGSNFMTVGLSTYTNSYWSDLGPGACSNGGQSIYCFQQ